MRGIRYRTVLSIQVFVLRVQTWLAPIARYLIDPTVESASWIVAGLQSENKATKKHFNKLLDRALGEFWARLEVNHSKPKTGPVIYPKDIFNFHLLKELRGEVNSLGNWVYIVRAEELARQYAEKACLKFKNDVDLTWSFRINLCRFTKKYELIGRGIFSVYLKLEEIFFHQNQKSE